MAITNGSKKILTMYHGNSKVFDSGESWKFKSGSTDVLPEWNMLYNIDGKKGKCILWGSIAARPSNGDTYYGRTLIDLSFLGSVKLLSFTLKNGGAWLDALSEGNKLVCRADTLSNYSQTTRFSSTLDGVSTLELN